MPTLAEILRQTGYSQDGTLAAPATDSPMTKVLSEHIKNLPQTTMQNLAKQRQDIDAALQMTSQGIQIADQDAFNRFMSEVPNVAALTAWHGTPHQIKGAFDINKIGTGEGNQSYGHGMYFAENPDVAIQYRKTLSTPFKETASANQLLDMANGNYDEALKLAQKNKNIAEIHSGKTEHIESANKTLDILNKMKNGQKLEFGNLYKVDIPDEHIPMMLDYDKPIKDQPEIYELVKSRFTDPDLLKTFEINAASGISGANVYKNYLGGKTDKERSENALALGIKGIRYLDEGSRASKITRTPITQLDAKIDFLKKDLDSGLGNKEVMERKLKVLQDERARTTNQTSNFVVFDPSTVKILEENSKPFTRKELIEQQVNKVLE